MITIKTKIKNLITPKTLFSIIPHLLETAWSKQQNVFAVSEIAIIFPGVACAWEASRMFCAKATEFAAVFSRIMKVIPKRHVARNIGLFR